MVAVGIFFIMVIKKIILYKIVKKRKIIATAKSNITWLLTTPRGIQGHNISLDAVFLRKSEIRAYFYVMDWTSYKFE